MSAELNTRKELMLKMSEKILNLNEDLERWKTNFDNCYSEMQIREQKLDKIKKIVLVDQYISFEDWQKLKEIII